MSYASGKYSIGICSRCRFKVPYTELREDGNIAGLYVCRDSGCYDRINPYKLPARVPEAVALHHPRPDASIAVTVNNSVATWDSGGAWDSGLTWL